MTYPQLDEVIKNEIGGITELIIDFKALDYIVSRSQSTSLSSEDHERSGEDDRKKRQRERKRDI